MPLAKNSFAGRAFGVLLAAVSSVLSAGAEDWPLPVAPAPSLEIQKQFGFNEFDFQTSFEECRRGSHAPVNNQTSVGIPGRPPMGFNYLMRLVYSEYNAVFTVITLQGEKHPYVLSNFKQSSPGGWLPGAVNEWDYDGIHYHVTYVSVPNDPESIDLCQITLANTSTHPAKGHLWVTLDGAPTFQPSGDLFLDRGKPMLIMDPAVPCDRIERDAGCVDPRAIASSPWHPGPCHEPWHHGRIGWYGLPVEYMLRSNRGESLQIHLGHMTSHHLCDAIETTVEGLDETRRLDLPRAMVEKANEGSIEPYLQQFTGKDTDGDGYIKISVKAAPDSKFQRSILNVLQAFDLDTNVSQEEILSGKSKGKARYWIDVGADYFGEINRLSVGRDPTVFAQRLRYEPELGPGETRKYLLKFLAIDRKEPAWCSYWPRPYDTKESWKGAMASTGRYPDNHALYGKDVPPGIDPEKYAVFGPKPREIWACQEQAARKINWDTGLKTLQDYWDGLVAKGMTIRVPDQELEELWKHQIAMLMIYRQQFHPYDYWMQVGGPDFYWEFCSRDWAYMNVAWDSAGFPEISRALLNTMMTPKSRLPPNRYPFGQWDDGSFEYDGAWQTRVNQWDAQGQTLWAISNHYLMTRDRDWLSEHYHSIAKGADWIIRHRGKEMERIADMDDPAYGLMPEAGDEPPIGGGHSFYVNAFAVLGLNRAAMLAKKLGREDDAEKFGSEAAALRSALNKALERTFVRFNDFAGTIATSVEVGNKLHEAPSSQRLLTDFGGALVWPTEAVEPFNPFMNGFIQYRSWIGSKSGGLMEWPYIFSDLALAHIRRGEADRAVDLFFAYVATAGDTNDWAETMILDYTFDEFEPARSGVRGQGDAPHGEACGNYINFLRNMLLHEEGNTLHIAPASPRRWLAQSKPFGVENAPTFFGPVTWSLQAEPDRSTIWGQVVLNSERRPECLVLHIRGQSGTGISSVMVNDEKWSWFTKEMILVPSPSSEIHLEVHYES